jgi:hypothetical protein
MIEAPIGVTNVNVKQQGQNRNDNDSAAEPSREPRPAAITEMPRTAKSKWSKFIPKSFSF